MSTHRTKRAESSVCYNGIGCFQSSGPYGYIDILPSPPEDVGTRFLLYNARRARGDTPLMDVPFSNLSAVFDWAGQAYNVSAPTKIIVHGFGSSCEYVWAYEMRSALMSVVSPVFELTWEVFERLSRNHNQPFYLCAIIFSSNLLRFTAVFLSSGLVTMLTTRVNIAVTSCPSIVVYLYLSITLGYRFLVLL